MSKTEQEFTAGSGPVRETEHCWIAMPDGVRLAARIWWPEGQGPFPALLEYIPYRKRDLVRARDERNHPYFAAHGYVCLRVDMRGSGDSEGHMPDMYARSELDDARRVIDWIAEQPWSNGRVGMFGTSWGGTASLQASVDAPRPLKAVIANCATADRFEDDIHWLGGGLLTDSFEWGATLPAILAAPPDAATVGENWKRLWRDRLDRLSFPLDAWIRNATRGDYWRHGSSLFDAERMTCPVLAVGGWADWYSNTVMRLVAARPDLCWGIVGPWGHHYPDHGEPGPAIGFQDLALEWWDHWLKDGEAPHWPKLRLWRREFDPPQDRLERRSGDWIEIEDPAPVTESDLYLGPSGLTVDAVNSPERVSIPNDLRHGQCAGDTGYFGRLGGLPLDQADDDARALCFDTAPLENDVTLIGHAEFTCELLRDLRDAQLVCRLCEVTPDGRSNLVTRTVLNLALDEKLDATAAFRPGEASSYRLRLPTTAYRFTKGNRIRLALGTSYWPLVWPVRQPATISVLTETARLRLFGQQRVSPLSKALPQVRQLPAVRSWESESAGPLKRGQGETPASKNERFWHQPSTTLHFPSVGVSITVETLMRYSDPGRSPNIFKCGVDYSITIRRRDGIATVRSELTAVQDGNGLSVEAGISVSWNDEEVSRKTWRLNY